VLFSASRATKAFDPNQMMFALDEVDETREIKLKVEEKIKAAEKREQLSRSIFAQHGIKADEIEKDLREADEFIGDPAAVSDFVKLSLALLGAELTQTSKGFKLHTTNLPDSLKCLLPSKAQVLVSFESPTPENYVYLGRNHAFVEQLCYLMMRNTLDHDHNHGASRAAVIRSSYVTERHTVYLCRCRNVIARKHTDSRIVAEEMLLWGYIGYHKDGKFLDHATAKKLLEDARSTQNMTLQALQNALDNEIKTVLPDLYSHMDTIALARSEKLVEAPHRFSK
jgi:hypothetical protein